MVILITDYQQLNAHTLGAVDNSHISRKIGAIIMAMTMYSWEKNYDRWDTEPDIVDEFVEDEIVTDEISLDDLADEEFELDESEFDLD